MADFHVYRDRLEIRLTRAEKLLALRRSDLVIPRDAIKSVAITADPWIWIRGVRAATSTSVPITLAVGVWRFHGGQDFLVLKSKSRSAVVIDVENPDEVDGFSRVMVSTQHATQLMEALHEITPDSEGPAADVIV